MIAATVRARCSGRVCTHATCRCMPTDGVLLPGGSRRCAVASSFIRLRARVGGEYWFNDPGLPEEGPSCL
jgi:hypothetical protein